MNKVLTVILAAVVLTGNLYAADENEMARNRIAFSAGLINTELSYERVISPHFSVLAAVSYNNLVFADSLNAGAKARLYPSGGTFFVELGVGYSNGYNSVDVFAQLLANIILTFITLGLWTPDTVYEDPVRMHGFLIQPGMGWNIDIGDRDGFMLPISMGLDIRLAEINTSLPFFRIGVAYAF